MTDLYLAVMAGAVAMPITAIICALIEAVE